MQSSTLYREVTPYHFNGDIGIEVEGRSCLDFSSNDYLGLRFNKEIQKAYCEGILKYGIGSGGSPLVCGYDSAKQSLEMAFANFLKKERGLLLNSGYSANLSLFQSYKKDKPVTFFIDKSSHASIYDAIAARDPNYTRLIRYRHGCMDHLALLLSQHEADDKVIVSEGIFSMTGLQSNLEALVNLKRQYNASLFIDDAHSIGVTGHLGEGSSYYTSEIDVVICPLGKAFAAHGALICSSHLIIEDIIQNGRAYIYSTALGSGLVQALNQALSVIQTSHNKRDQLRENITYFNKLCRQSTFNFLDTNTAIKFLVTACPQKALELFNYLKEQLIFCYPMREPTVKKQSTGLRFVLHATHSKQDYDYLFEKLRLVL